MGAESNIEWTEATWNPVRGCSRVSKGCENCYAEHVARRYAGPGMPYEGLVRLDPKGKPKAQWNGTVRVIEEHLGDPLRWARPRRIFVNSMSDLFHESIADEVIAAIFGVMAAAPQHTFQILTKRAQRAREWFRWYEGTSGAGASPTAALYAAAEHLDDPRARHELARELGSLHEWPLPNVWLGVSVEDQASADERIPILLETPAALRWVSYEPAIGPVDFTSIDICQGKLDHPHDPIVRFDALRGHMKGPNDLGYPRLGWIVIGGESGHAARPFDPAWARAVIEQAASAGVPVFVKQLGSKPVLRTDDVSDSLVRDLDAAGWDENHGPPVLQNRKGGDPAEWAPELRVRQYPEVGRAA